MTRTTAHGPFVVPEAEIVDDFVTTRLEAVIHPHASVGQVNDALTASGAKISCMRPDLMFVELVIPAQATRESAATLCSVLVASGAFLFADPAYVPVTVSESQLFPDNPANGIVKYLEEQGFGAAWNTRELVAATNAPVTVVVADHFSSFSPHPEIPAQTFPLGKGKPNLNVEDGNAVGNHGFMVAGVIGARFDAIGSTGVYADPASLLRLRCVGVSGLASIAATLIELNERLPDEGQFILNTSFATSTDGTFAVISKRTRITHALAWRALVAGKQDRFLHATAAGNQGIASDFLPNATYTTPFALSARFDGPIAMLAGSTVSAKDSADLTLLYTAMVDKNPATATRTRNLLVVGSSDLDGNLSTFSNLPSDVRMIGEILMLPCDVADARCAAGSGVDLQGMVSGTSFSSPQVAGLAAWMWSLSPALSVDKTIGILRNCYNGKWVDAYKAVLSLDPSEASATVRQWILDVANGNGQKGSNGAFDEKDLQMYVDSIEVYEQERIASGPPFSRDHSIFDLNGDGFTGDIAGASSTAPFDLDVNVPPAYTSVSVVPCDAPSVNDATLDENALTDRDILFYYAYSQMFTGNDSLRDELFGVSCNPFAITDDSSLIRLQAQLPTLGIQLHETSTGSMFELPIDESRDSISPGCTKGYRFRLSPRGETSLVGAGGSTGFSINGTSSASVVAEAVATEPSSCVIGMSGVAQSMEYVEFTIGDQQNQLPFTLVVSGTVSPFGLVSGQELARCIVSLSPIVTFDTDLPGSTLPFQFNGFLTPLPEGQFYRLTVTTFAQATAATNVDPGPNSAQAAISVSLIAGP